MFTPETYRNRSAFQTKPKIIYKAIFLFCEIIACTRKSLWEQLAKMRIKSNRKETWAVVNKCAIHHMHLMLFSIPTSIAVIGTCIFFFLSRLLVLHMLYRSHIYKQVNHAFRSAQTSADIRVSNKCPLLSCKQLILSSQEITCNQVCATIVHSSNRIFICRIPFMSSVHCKFHGNIKLIDKIRKCDFYSNEL